MAESDTVEEAAARAAEEADVERPLGAARPDRVGPDGEPLGARAPERSPRGVNPFTPRGGIMKVTV